MKEKYISFEVRYPSELPTEEGRYCRPALFILLDRLPRYNPLRGARL